VPVHDWKRVEAGIFHDFHLSWIGAIRSALNSGLLPPDYYALAEQQTGGFGPDVVSLRGLGKSGHGEPTNGVAHPSGPGLVVAPPQTRIRFESRQATPRLKGSPICIRHVSGDDVVAVIEIISPGNKTGKKPFRALVDKACALLDNGIHLLVLDLFPPGKRDPNGFHGALWEELEDEPFHLPAAKPLTQVAYEVGESIKAYVEPIAVGDVLPPMPLFLEPGGHVVVPLEATYQAAWEEVPRRWQQVVSGDVSE